MVIFYKKWKKYNEIQLTKNKMNLNIRKNAKLSTLPQKGNNNKHNRQELYKRWKKYIIIIIVIIIVSCSTSFDSRKPIQQIIL